MKALSSKVLLAVAALTFAGVVVASPVTYKYDSGTLESLGADNSRIGNHFTAAFTFSDDVNPTTGGCVYASAVNGSGCGTGPQAGKLLNWSVKSGDFTLDPSNAHFVNDTYPGLLISIYKTSGLASMSYLTFVMDVIGNDTNLGLHTIGRRFEGGNGLNNLNLVRANLGYLALNKGGSSVVLDYNYTGPGGLLDIGGSGDGGTGGSSDGSNGGSLSSVPLPGPNLMMLTGLGVIAAIARRRKSKQTA